jgi:hypothetical protein
MTLRGKPLSEEQKSEIAAAVHKNLPLRGWRVEQNSRIGTMAEAFARTEGSLTPYHKSGRLRGSMRSH